jgi:hypothetical protein
MVVDPRCLLDKKLGCFSGRIPLNVHDGIVYVIDTLDICWASAR